MMAPEAMNSMSKHIVVAWVFEFTQIVHISLVGKNEFNSEINIITSICVKML